MSRRRRRSMQTIIDAIEGHELAVPAADLYAGHFDSNHVMALAGITRRQIQWWDEQRLVSPVHHAHKRYYTPQQTALVIVIAQLLKKGYTHPMLRKLARGIVKAIDEAAAATVRSWLVLDRKRVTWVEDLDRLANFQGELPVTVLYLTPHLRAVGLGRV